MNNHITLGYMDVIMYPLPRPKDDEDHQHIHVPLVDNVLTHSDKAIHICISKPESSLIQLMAHHITLLAETVLPKTNVDFLRFYP